MAVLTPSAKPTDPTELAEVVHPLENGDRLTRAEFERRYEAMPHLKKAELIEGVVYVASPVRHKYHGKQHHHLLTWIGHYEAGTPGLEGIVLRYGGLYGSGTSIAPGGEQSEIVRKRQFPLVGDGGGVWSFIHVADAAEATVAAAERGRRGVYNVVDDDPAVRRQRHV